VTKADIPDIARPVYFSGQRLTADDLTAGQAFHRELRWLHNRGLHTWGIAFGLAVRGERGDGAVTVTPGYAVDCQGRDLVLDEDQIVPVPSVAGASGAPATWYLTVSYQEDADRPVLQIGQGVCFDDGATRRSEGGLIRWQKAGDPRPGLDVVLARGDIVDCVLDTAVSPAERRDARPAQQPYVGAGSTSGSTSWAVWESEAGDVLGLRATVDTSTAGFGSTPRYAAHVVGSRLGTEAPARGVVVEGFTSIVQTDRTSFELRLLLPRALRAGIGVPINPDALLDDKDDLVKAVADWYVVWLGVEG
jgi:hypothetical protein